MVLMMAAPTTLKIHIEAPVEKVFEFFADPRYMEKFLTPEDRAKVAFKDVVVTPEGVGTHYTVATKEVGLPYEYRGHYTEFVPNERIVDTLEGHLAGTFIYTFQPEGSGMQFTMEHIPGAIGKVPIVGGALEARTTHRHQEVLEELKRMMEA